MANARAKKKAKSASKKPAKKLAASKKVARKTAPKKVVAKKAAAKKPAPKKVTKPAKKPAAKAAKKPAAPKPVAAKAPLAPAVGRALAQADVEGLVSRLPPPVQPVVNTLRRLVLEAAPEASEQLDDGAPAYFANGVFARIEPKEREVLVRFLKGGQLPSHDELQGDTMTLSSVDQLKETVLRKLVREAVMLNLSAAPGAPAQA